MVTVNEASIISGQNEISVKLEALPIGNIEFGLGGSLGSLETFEKTFGIFQISSDFEIEILVDTGSLVVGERIDFRLDINPETILGKRLFYTIYSLTILCQNFVIQNGT